MAVEVSMSLMPPGALDAGGKLVYGNDQALGW